MKENNMKTVREFIAADRYLFDTEECTPAAGWAQVDTEQDAWYFGIWANPETLEIVTYCEGDVTRDHADSAGEFAQALRDMESRVRGNGGWLRIDPGFSPNIIGAKFRSMGLGDLIH